jgi:REP element-mobilizing transposase RayT
MLIQPYQLQELRFAWCNRIYFRTRTHRRKPVSALAKLSVTELADILRPYEVELLEFTATELEIRGLLSLTPFESTSSALSKTKGRISLWLREQLGESAKVMAKGYFAVTTGQSVSAAVDEYLESQAAHHGYADRANPPVFVRSMAQPDEMARRLETDHAVTRLRYHLVFVVPRRKGLFHAESAAEVTARWLELPGKFLIDKVSFLPDHVHIAVSVHPTVAPAQVTCELMNCSQELIWKRHSSSVVRAGVERLWRPSAYIGSFGDLSSNAISAYLQHWLQSSGD